MHVVYTGEHRALALVLADVLRRAERNVDSRSGLGEGNAARDSTVGARIEFLEVETIDLLELHGELRHGTPGVLDLLRSLHARAVGGLRLEGELVGISGTQADIVRSLVVVLVKARALVKSRHFQWRD